MENICLFNKRYYLGIFLVAASTLLFEICLSKVFSIIHFHYFAFFIISTALFGYGLSGVLLSISKSLKNLAVEKSLFWCSFLFAVTSLISYRIILSLPLRIQDVFTLQQFSYLLIVYVALTIPFLFSGLTIGTLLTSYGSRINKLYFLDLLGAGIGCMLIVLLIPQLGGSGTILSAVLLAFAASLTFRTKISQLIAVLLAIVVCTAILPSAERYFPSAGQSEKRYFRDSMEKKQIIYTGWSPASRIDVAYSGRRRLVIWIDGGTNQSAMLRRFQKIKVGAKKDQVLRTIELPFLFIENPNVMMIGPGGGVEVGYALDYGAKQITAVELDPVITKIVKGEFREYIGDIYSHPRVRLINEEGRSFVRRSKEKYDIIQQINNSHPMAVASGALNLTETYLLTKEAFHEYLNHLSSNGILAIQRHAGIRLLNLGYEVLKERNVTEPQKQMVLIKENDLNQAFFLKNGEFTDRELGLMKTYCDQVGDTILFDPINWKNSSNIFSKLLDPDTREKILKTAPFDLNAPTDNWPFIEHFFRLRTVFDRKLRLAEEEPFWRAADLFLLRTKESTYSDLSVYVILIQGILLSSIFIILPLFRFKREGLPTQNALRFLIYFCCLGIGFILVEISFIQKYILFLGYPVYSVAVILFALLISAGAGSYFSSLLNLSTNRMIQLAIISLIVLNACQLFLVPKLFNYFLSISFPGRILLAILFIMPQGFVMGIPFPVGLSWTSRHYPEFVPWAWGINGYATVIGSVLAVILALHLGFQLVLIISTVIYVVAYLAIRSVVRADVEPARNI